MRISRKAAVVSAVTAALVYLAGASAAETMKIGDCMKCQNKARKELGSLAKSGDWDKAAEKSKTWLAAAGDLGKNKPPLGDEKSWKEQTDKYVSNVKAVDAAVGKKDGAGVTKALQTFGTSCGGCHSKHKPK